MTSSPGFDARIALQASRQGAAFSRRQAFAAGATDPMIGRRIRSGRWRRAHPGVYVLAGAPGTWLQEVWCAVLAVGPAATVSHETALLLHGVQQVGPRPITLTSPHGSHPRVDGAFVHQLDDLRPGHVVQIDGLPVTRVERTLVDLAACLGERRLGTLVDDVVWTRRTTLARVGDCLQQVARPGKRGMAGLARVLDARSDGPVPAQSVLERALFAALAAGGLPAPVRQAELPGRGAIEGMVDACYPDVRLILEADGRRWHTRVRDLRRDHERDAEAARVGWQTLRFVHEQVVGDPAEVCAVVAEVRAARRALVPGGAASSPRGNGERPAEVEALADGQR